MKNNPQTLGSDNAAQLTNRLRELELFTEVIPDGVLIFNTELLIEAVNESAQALLGLPEACVGRLLSETINAPRLNSYPRARSASSRTGPQNRESSVSSSRRRDTA